MAWVKLDDQFFINPKARAVGLEGRALALASWCYCAMQRNDGIFPAGDVPIIAAMAGVPDETAGRLIDHGLWHAIEGDQIQVHDYLDHNLSREQMAERSAKASKAATTRHAQSSASSTAPSRPASNAPSVPIPSPSPEGSLSSSSSSDLVPEAVWLEAAKKKAAMPKANVGNFARWSPTVIAADKAEKGDDAAWIWATYEISVDQLAGIIATGDRHILNVLRKREDPAA